MKKKCVRGTASILASLLGLVHRYLTKSVKQLPLIFWFDLDKSQGGTMFSSPPRLQGGKLGDDLHLDTSILTAIA